MLEEKHMKQISKMKLELYIDKLYEEILADIKLQSNYFSDVEQVVCMVLLGEKILRVCEKSLEKQDVQLIKDYFVQERENCSKNEK